MSVRLGSKRRRDGGFQWLMIGIVLGMGCAFSFGLALYVFEVIEVRLGAEEATPTSIVRFVTLAPDETQGSVTPNGEVSPVEMTGIETIDTSAGGSSTETQSTRLPESSNVPATTQQQPAVGITPSPLSGGPTHTPTIAISISGSSAVNPQAVSGADSTAITPGVPPPAVSLPPELMVSLTPLVYVQGGTFKMGTTEEEGLIAVNECVSRDAGLCVRDMIDDSIPPHDVVLTDFYIEKYEVSVAQYVAFLNYLLSQNPGTRPHLVECGGPCVLTVQDTGGENSDISFDGERYTVRVAGVDRSNLPVTLVYWAGAKKYCETVGRYLPSEAQWERAARGVNNWIYPWGQQWNPDLANTNRSGKSGQGLAPVTDYPGGASSWGALNMAGNAGEWTADYYSATLYQEQANTVQVNPVNTNVSSKVVVRGGAWDTVPLFVRTVHRRDIGPGDPNPALGFRCASNTP